MVGMGRPAGGQIDAIHPLADLPAPAPAVLDLPAPCPPARTMDENPGRQRSARRPRAVAGDRKAPLPRPVPVHRHIQIGQTGSTNRLGGPPALSQPVAPRPRQIKLVDRVGLVEESTGDERG